MQYSAEAAHTAPLTSLCENLLDRDNFNLKMIEISFPPKSLFYKRGSLCANSVNSYLVIYSKHIFIYNTLMLPPLTLGKALSFPLLSSSEIYSTFSSNHENYIISSELKFFF